MRKSSTIILLLCGIVFGLAAFPVFAQKAPVISQEARGEIKDEKVKDVVINRLPLRDFAEYFKAKIERGDVDLEKPFKVVVEGILIQDGKFDIRRDKETGKPKTQFILSEGDEKMVEVAKKAIEAIGDSGWFGYLRNLGAEKIKLTVAQDGETFSAKLESDLNDEAKAKTLVSGLSMMLKMVKMHAEERIAKFGEDEMTIINGFQTPTADGKNFILNFALPQKTFHEIILRELKKAEDNKQSGE